MISVIASRRTGRSAASNTQPVPILDSQSNPSQSPQSALRSHKVGHLQARVRTQSLVQTFIATHYVLTWDSNHLLTAPRFPKCFDICAASPQNTQPFRDSTHRSQWRLRSSSATAMEQHQALPAHPPSYFEQSHDPDTISLPSVPSAELPPIGHEAQDRTLPSLSCLAAEASYAPPAQVNHKYAPTAWPSSNPYTTYYQSNGSQVSPIHKAAIGVDSPGAMEIDTSTPERQGHRGDSVLSIDDPDVRLAAEALGDLRAGMSVWSAWRKTCPDSAKTLYNPPHTIIPAFRLCSHQTFNKLLNRSSLS